MKHISGAAIIARFFLEVIKFFEYLVYRCGVARVTWGNMRCIRYLIFRHLNYFIQSKFLLWLIQLKKDLNPTTGHGWVDKLKLTQDLYYPCINKQLNQSKIMIFSYWKYTLLPEAIKNVSIWTQRDFFRSFSKRSSLAFKARVRSSRNISSIYKLKQLFKGKTRP